jgi:chorismate--pyruvate lyase
LVSIKVIAYYSPRQSPQQYFSLMPYPKIQSQYPIGCQADWYCASKLDSSLLDQWLLHTGSLTEKLKEHCQQFEVLVIGQQPAPLSESEATLMPSDETYLVREVLLICDGTPWVFARSLLPLSLVEQHSALANLGNQSLGSIIFNSTTMQRMPFEVARFDDNSTVVELAKQLNQQLAKPLWGRRSLFSEGQYKLMVSEVFLPQSPAYS